MIHPFADMMGKRRDARNEKKAKQEHVDKEMAFGGNSYLYLTGSTDERQALEIEVYNADEIISRKGIDCYKKIRRDDQVKSALLVKKFGRLSTGWRIIAPRNATPVEKEATEYVRYVTEKIIFRKVLKGLMTALDFGYSVNEENFMFETDGKYSGNVSYKNIKSKDPADFTFVTDEYDNLKYIKQGVNELPVNKFAIYAYNQEFENPYGLSDLNSVYKNWWLKDTFTKFWAIYMERFGIPTVVGTYPPFSITAVKTALQNVLKGIQHKTSVSMQSDLKIDLLDVAKEKGDIWIACLETLDNRMARAILCPQLLGVANTKFGSYALGKKQFDLFIWVLNELGNELSSCVINPQIINRLVDYNYKVVRYPQFKFKPMNAENYDKLLQIWLGAVKNGTLTKTGEDEEHIRASLGMPTSDEVE